MSRKMQHSKNKRKYVPHGQEIRYVNIGTFQIDHNRSTCIMFGSIKRGSWHGLQGELGGND